MGSDLVDGYSGPVRERDTYSATGVHGPESGPDTPTDSGSLLTRPRTTLDVPDTPNLPTR